MPAGSSPQPSVSLLPSELSEAEGLMNILPVRAGRGRHGLKTSKSCLRTCCESTTQRPGWQLWDLRFANSSTPTAGISTRETLRALGSLPCPEFRAIHTRRGRQVPGGQHRGSCRSQSQVRAQVAHVSPCVVAWHMGLVAATRLSEQHRAVQDCDSNAGTQTMGFRDFFEIQVTALSQNSTG